MRRRHFLALLAAAPFAPSLARAGEAGITAPLSYDSHGRPLVPVMLNGQGPFLLVLDTAAGATVLSPATIAQLALTPNERRVNMQGASGAVQIELYTLPILQLGALRREAINVAPLPNNPSAEGHAGVLGAGVLLDTRAEFDFAANALRVDTSANRAPLTGANLIEVQLRHRTFAITTVSVDGVQTTAVLDTGARRSVGNIALRNALGFSEGDTRLRAAEPIGGATTDTTAAFAADARSVTFAGHDFGAFELAFADLPVFRTMQFSATPAIILGIELLRRTRGFTLDYTSGQLQLRV